LPNLFPYQYPEEDMSVDGTVSEHFFYQRLLKYAILDPKAMSIAAMLEANSIK
jgi:hypothetical protein